MKILGRFSFFFEDPNVKFAELREEIRRMTLPDDMQDSEKGRRSSPRDLDNMRTRTSVSCRTESNQTLAPGRRRSSIDKDDVVPFYLKKRYDHHQLSIKAPRLLQRRNALTLEDEKYLFEGQLLAPSADLGTISFKSAGVDRSWLNADLRKEREEAIRRQPESNMDFQHKHRPGSGKQVFCIEKYTQGNREFSSSPECQHKIILIWIIGRRLWGSLRHKNRLLAGQMCQLLGNFPVISVHSQGLLRQIVTFARQILYLIAIQSTD